MLKQLIFSCIVCVSIPATAMRLEASELAMNVEIEMKFQVLSEPAIEQFVNKLTFLGKKRMVDVYLDTPTADLLKRGLWIRIRDKKKIEYKFNRACLADPTLEMQPYCEEYSFSCPLQSDQLNAFNSLNDELALHRAATLVEFMQRNTLIEHRVVDKIRSTYKHDLFTIVVDKIEGLGTFLEIELMANTSDHVVEVKTKMDEVLAGLELKRIKTSYDVLLLRKNNFEEYLQSRFILDEDKDTQKELNILK